MLSGHVHIPQNVAKEKIPSSLLERESSGADDGITKDDVYRTLSVRQYQYNSKFQQLESFNYKSTNAIPILVFSRNIEGNAVPSVIDIVLHARR